MAPFLLWTLKAITHDTTLTNSITKTNDCFLPKATYFMYLYVFNMILTKLMTSNEPNTCCWWPCPVQWEDVMTLSSHKQPLNGPAYQVVMMPFPSTCIHVYIRHWYTMVVRNSSFLSVVDLVQWQLFLRPKCIVCKYCNYTPLLRSCTRFILYFHSAANYEATTVVRPVW